MTCTKRKYWLFKDPPKADKHDSSEAFECQDDDKGSKRWRHSIGQRQFMAAHEYVIARYALVFFQLGVAWPSLIITPGIFLLLCSIPCVQIEK